MSQLEKKIKISIVNYFNTLPFRYGLKNSLLINKIDLQEDIPSICAQKLKYNQVDVGLVPVALLPELDHYKIITDYCIGADGCVDSVKLYSDVPLEEIKTITLDYQSKSSITLTKVLVKFLWKIEIMFLEGKPGFENNISGTNAGVVIGDRTFSLNNSFKYEYDLSEEWKKLTGLPFVFACWVSTQDQDSEFVKELNAVLKWGLEHTGEALTKEQKTFPTNFDPHDYLKNKISYNLDAKKLEALQLFLNYIGKL